MQGSLLAFAPKVNFTLLAGEDALKEYRFNKKVITHLFCDNCGIEPISRGNGPDGSETVAVNVRCIDDIDLSLLSRMPYDGKKLQ